MSMTLLEFSSQCCDAEEYLRYGFACAENGECYNELRPMGAIYWFSIPYRLGIDAEFLIVGHSLLTIVSVCLSVIAVQKLVRLLKHDISITKKATYSLLIASTLVHAAFLYPVFRNSLSDLPASIMFLIGTWCLVSTSTETRNKALWLLVAGISLGFSAWVRVFFLYPVIFIVVVLNILAYMRKDKVLALSLVALIPIATQFLAVYQRTGVLAFTDPKIAERVQEVHMALDATGYDTILEPLNSWAIPQAKTWRSGCGEYLPPSEIIKTFDMHSLMCLLTGKLHFYLGSYGDRTYYQYQLNILEHPTIFQSDKNHAESRCQHINFLTSTQQQPKPTRYYVLPESIEAVVLSKADPHASAEAYCEMWLEQGYFYSMAMWLWADPGSDHIIEFFIREKAGGTTISSNTILLSPYPNLADTVGKIEKSGVYQLGIKSLIYESGTVVGDAIRSANKVVNAGSFYTWDPQILRDKRNPWDPVAVNETNMPKRLWSTPLLLLNLFVLSMALWFIFRLAQRRHTEGYYLLLTFIPICLMSLAIVPEQRFAIAPMIIMWILFIAWLTHLVMASSGPARKI